MKVCKLQQSQWVEPLVYLTMVKILQTPWIYELQMKENNHHKGGPFCPKNTWSVANEWMWNGKNNCPMREGRNGALEILSKWWKRVRKVRAQAQFL